MTDNQARIKAKEQHVFKAGDKAMLITRSPWHGDKCEVVTIAKVYKTGRFIVEGSREQWKKSFGNMFVRCSGSIWHDNVHIEPYTYDRYNELTVVPSTSRDRELLNKVGKALANIRDDGNGARLWAELPDCFKKLLEVSK